MKDDIMIITFKYKVAAVSASYENASWKYVIASMVAYAFQPVLLPCMILLSKLTHRKIEFLPVEVAPKN